MTPEEKKMLEEHYKRLAERAIAEKKCITCKFLIRVFPFPLDRPPLCELGGEAARTCERYEISEEWKKEG